MDSKLGSEKTFVFESRKQTKVQLCDEREKKKCLLVFSSYRIMRKASLTGWKAINAITTRDVVVYRQPVETISPRGARCRRINKTK